MDKVRKMNAQQKVADLIRRYNDLSSEEKLLFLDELNNQKSTCRTVYFVLNHSEEVFSVDLPELAAIVFINRKIHIYDVATNELCVSKTNLKSIKLDIKNQNLTDHFFYHRSYVISFALFNDIPAGKASDLLIYAVFERYGISLQSGVLRRFKSEWKRYRSNVSSVK